MDSISSLRKCSKCKQDFPATTEYFSPFKKGKGGLYSLCKACAAKASKLYRIAHPEKVKQSKKKYQDAHPERVHASQKKWREENKEYLKIKQQEYCANNKEMISARDKDYRERNSETLRVKHHEYRQKNKEVLRIRNAEYRNRNRLILRAAWRKRKARKRNAEGYHTKQDIVLQFKTQNGLCWWCGCKLDPNNYHVDHRKPLSRGGTNWPNNLVCSCPKCNLAKNNKMPGEFNGRLL